MCKAKVAWVSLILGVPAYILIDIAVVGVSDEQRASDAIIFKVVVLPTLIWGTIWGLFLYKHWLCSGSGEEATSESSQPEENIELGEYI
jgi:hypothetical protein